LPSDEERKISASTVRDAVALLNSLFLTAKIDVSVGDVSLAREGVVIGSPQIEDYGSELSSIDQRDGIENAARYLIAAVISTEGRQVQVYVRFYLQSDGTLKIEGCDADNVTVQADEAEQPKRWSGALESAERWGPVIVNMILKLLGHIG